MRCRALLVLALCWVPLARANLLPNLYLFSERPPPVPLALGSVLYYFYQDDYPATLQEALYVEHRFGTNVPGRDLLLLAKGSAALGLGMLNQARIWLAEVDTKRLPPNALPRLHLAMARVAFLDGDDVLCGQYLNELSPELDARPDVNYLRVELARRAHDLRAMATSLARLPEETPFWFFGWHNYAVTARELHELDTAASAFDRVHRHARGMHSAATSSCAPHWKARCCAFSNPMLPVPHGAWMQSPSLAVMAVWRWPSARTSPWRRMTTTPLRGCLPIWREIRPIVGTHIASMP